MPIVAMKASLCDQKTVDEAEQCADREDDEQHEQRVDHAQLLIDIGCRADAGGDDGANGDIDVAADDDEAHTNGEDRVLRRLLQDVEDVQRCREGIRASD